MEKTNYSILKEIYKPRQIEARKYDFGFLLVLGGSEHYTGSPALSALAAFRAGVDMVRILAPKRAADIIAGFSPNICCTAFEGKWFDDEDVSLALSHAKSVQTVAGDKTAVLMGGGMGRSEETKKAMLDFLRECPVNVVIDADGLHAVAKEPAVLSGKKCILTPHAYEFFVLTGKDIKGFSLEEKVQVVKEAAVKIGAVIILKGAVDIISNGSEVVLNKTGSAFMTVGGTGDTLAGIAGALLACGIEPFLAAKGAAYINGRAGELASKKFGPGMLATDVIDFIPEVIKSKV